MSSVSVIGHAVLWQARERAYAVEKWRAWSRNYRVGQLETVVLFLTFLTAELSVTLKRIQLGAQQRASKIPRVVSHGGFVLSGVWKHVGVLHAFSSTQNQIWTAWGGAQSNSLSDLTILFNLWRVKLVAVQKICILIAKSQLGMKRTSKLMHGLANAHKTSKTWSLQRRRASIIPSSLFFYAYPLLEFRGTGQGKDSAA